MITTVTTLSNRSDTKLWGCACGETNVSARSTDRLIDGRLGRGLFRNPALYPAGLQLRLNRAGGEPWPASFDLVRMSHFSRSRGR